MEKYYRTQLEKFNATGLKIWEIITATEVDSYAYFNDDDFEIVCDFVYDWILATEMSATELTNIIINCLKAKEFTIKDIENNKEKVRDIINDKI